MGKGDATNAKFIATINSFTAETINMSIKVKQEIAKELFRRIINRTPIGIPNLDHTGDTKGNWTASKNKPSSAILKRIDPTGDATIAAIERVVDGWMEGKSVFLANSSPNIEVLEDGGYIKSPEKGTWNPNIGDYEIRSQGGYSKQAPNGFVKVSLTEFESIVDMVARKHKVTIR